MNSPGLRERKKQKTRWAIQEQALRLFREQGYEATTVDQIAAAAEISPSTFFRYFPSKEDLVIADEYDALLIAGLKNAPAELAPIAAIRDAAERAFTTVTPADDAKIRERTELIMSVPALRARSLDNFLSTMELLRVSLAERTGRDPDDLELRVLAGAVVGAMVAAIEVWLADPGVSLVHLVDQVLAKLEAGLSL